MDFPSIPPVPTHISNYGMFSGLYGTATVCASLTWTTANRAIYTPMFLPWPYPVNRVFWGNGSVSAGNKDFGIYTAGGTKLYSTGSTAESGTSTLQYVTPSTPFVLAPGAYYFAIVCDGTTNRGWGAAITSPSGAMYGLLLQTSALPLPATATFATHSGATSNFLCGITRTASGF